MSGHLITLENVSWTYRGAGAPALDHISMAIGEGEFIAVMGENGAGKTSLCRLLNGLIPHSLPGKLSGTVTVDGIITASSRVSHLAQKVGMVFDDPPSQLFTATVTDEIAFALENMLVGRDVIKEKLRWALNVTGLASYADYAPSALSGGQQQRLAIAAALAMAAKILVLDEPTSQLDTAGAREILSLIRELRAQKGLTVIMAANAGAEAAECADRICVLQNGKLAADGAPQAICADRQWKEIFIMNGVPSVQYEEKITGKQQVGGKIPSSPAIQIANLSYHYTADHIILNDVNLSIEENEFIAITGPNGGGKTTLLKNISGLLRPVRGNILIRGRDAADMGIADIAAEIGLVMQNPDRQLFCSTVYDEAAFALRKSRRKRALTKDEIHDTVESALSMAGLQDLRSAFPPALNRADRVKTVFAAVLAMGPRIIMMDEPFAGQDMRGCRLITDALAHIHQQGYTIIIVTHNISVIAEYAQRIIELGIPIKPMGLL